MTAAQTAASVIAGASAVTSLVGTRYWPDFRANDTLPAITFQNISDTRYDHLGAPGKGKQIRVQFNCYATTRNGADALADALETALSSTGRVVFRQATYDTDVEIYWTQLDWLTLIDSP